MKTSRGSYYGSSCKVVELIFSVEGNPNNWVCSTLIISSFISLHFKRRYAYVVFYTIFSQVIIVEENEFESLMWCNCIFSSLYIKMCVCMVFVSIVLFESIFCNHPFTFDHIMYRVMNFLIHKSCWKSSWISYTMFVKLLYETA